MVWVTLREARLPMLAAVMAGFGGVISEIGASMMVGGNIKGQTRTLTTAMVLETGKGNFEIAIALSILLDGAGVRHQLGAHRGPAAAPGLRRRSINMLGSAL